MKIRPLEWDSALFGYLIGMLEITFNPTREQMEAYKSAATEYRLVYVFSPFSLTTEEPVDCKVIFRKSITPGPSAYPHHPSNIMRHEGLPNERLYSLALASGTYSRYRTDIRFDNGEFEKLYRIWLTRSVSGEIADAVYVAVDGGSIAGIITFQNTAPGGTIGLVAVDSEFRGRGLGHALLDTVEWYGAQSNWSYVEVATQSANHHAVKFYMAAGYTVFKTINIYHWWNR